ncbi:substrate-binding periplasmic protein [Glaciecola sp. 1036]|uniref:substrate-binding periplasmic protein n=1 Tax=Alteromonadaceae TaxID=72275 RepID=UPI003D0825D4
MFKSIIFFTLIVFSMTAHAQLKLVGNKVETFIYDDQEPARLMRVVETALDNAGIEYSLTSTTQAWSGSGLRSGKYNGYIDHYSLNEENARYVYSNTYATIALHVASRKQGTLLINRFDQLTGQRIGIEKRFANTDRLRSERTVNWARRDSFHENIQQLSEGRVDYVLADKLMLAEINKLLIAVDEEPLIISERPILKVQIKLAVNQEVDGAMTLLNKFDAAINKMRNQEIFDEIYLPAASAPSILDPALYSEILRKW